MSMMYWTVPYLDPPPPSSSLTRPLKGTPVGDLNVLLQASEAIFIFIVLVEVVAEWLVSRVWILRARDPAWVWASSRW